MDEPRIPSEDVEFKLIEAILGHQRISTGERIMSLSQQKRIETTALWLDNLSNSLFVAGIATPLIGLALGVVEWKATLAMPIVYVLTGCFVGSLGLHLMGQALLGRIK